MCAAYGIILKELEEGLDLIQWKVISSHLVLFSLVSIQFSLLSCDHSDIQIISVTHIILPRVS